MHLQAGQLLGRHERPPPADFRCSYAAYKQLCPHDGNPLLDAKAFDAHGTCEGETMGEKALTAR